MVRRRGDQGHAQHRVTQSGDVRSDLVARQLAAFARLGALRHLNLDHVGVHQVGRRHAEAAGGYLFDARHLVGAVARRIFAAFAGVGEAAEAVHGDRQRLVRFRAQCADRHRRGVEAFEQRLRRFNLIDRDRFAFRRDGQQIAQHGDRPLVHQLGVGLIVTVFPAVHRFCSEFTTSGL